MSLDNYRAHINKLEQTTDEIINDTHVIVIDNEQFFSVTRIADEITILNIGNVQLLSAVQLVINPKHVLHAMAMAGYLPTDYIIKEETNND